VGVILALVLFATWLIATTSSSDAAERASVCGLQPGDTFDDRLLRVLGACLVADAALWLAALAASRLERPLLPTSES
jgi:hypothetical protein